MTVTPYLIGTGFTNAGGTITITLLQNVAVGDLIYIAMGRKVNGAFPWPGPPYTDTYYGQPVDSAGNAYYNNYYPGDPANQRGTPTVQASGGLGVTDMVRWFAFSTAAMLAGSTITIAINPATVYVINEAVAVAIGCNGPFDKDNINLPGSLSAGGGGTVGVYNPIISTPDSLAIASVLTFPIADGDISSPLDFGYTLIGQVNSTTTQLACWWLEGSSPTYYGGEWESVTITQGISWADSFAINNIALGDFITSDCSIIEITGISGVPGEYTGTVTGELSEIPDSPDGALVPIAAGSWFTTTPAQTFSGLDHLEGKEVWALADGFVVGPLTVALGAVDLGFSAANAVIGLRYTQQIKTLYLTAEGLNTGSEQGKRKFLPAVTLRVDCTKGLSAGHDFTSLSEVPDLILAGTADTLFTGDARVNIGPFWDTNGEICIQQTDPLPAQVLGVIVEVVPGDTGR